MNQLSDIFSQCFLETVPTSLQEWHLSIEHPKARLEKELSLEHVLGNHLQYLT